MRGEVGVCRERVVELEAAVQDKQAQVKIVERKSQSLVRKSVRYIQCSLRLVHELSNLFLRS